MRFGKPLEFRQDLQRGLDGVGRQLPAIEPAGPEAHHFLLAVDDLEGQIESYDLGRRSLAEEIAELESAERIDEELAALKSRMRSQASSPDRSSMATPSASGDNTTGNG